MKFKTGFILFLGALVLIVLLQNVEVVSLKILFWDITMSRIIFMPLILFVGFIIGFFVGRRSWDW